MTADSTTLQTWPGASRKRRVLAIYLDYLLFAVPWALTNWAIGKSWPGVENLSFLLNLFFFAALEWILFAFVKWSPGLYCLSVIPDRRPAHEVASDPQEQRPVHRVDPWILANERWWTVLFGVFSILDGAKCAVRWSLFQVPMPFMGMELSPGIAGGLDVLFGGLEIAIGIAVLRLSTLGPPAGFALLGIQLASTVANWPLLPAWVAENAAARRAYQGLAPRPGEIEFMQATVPLMSLAFVTLAILWVIAVGVRIRTVRKSATAPRAGL